jgi:hypothetical protein
MQSEIDFNLEERSTLERAVRTASRGKDWLTLYGLFGDWEALVGAVEMGYPEDIYEYLNDLAARDVLEDVILSVEAALAKKLAAALSPIDERFIATTRPSQASLVEGAPRDRPWWHRVPIQLKGALLNDMTLWGITR